MTKIDLRQLHDASFAWPTETSVYKIPVLPKNIVKNFMQMFFTKFGFCLTIVEGWRVLQKVRVGSFPLCLLFFIYLCLIFSLL
jgi:hypothetical protein